jgi:lipopolysaccharide export system ATP-binding protein
VSEFALRVEAVRAALKGTEVLRRVDLVVAPGQILGVLGPNGAGKSTLFRVIAGELEPLSGRLWLDSNEITTLPLWARARLGLGYVPQTPSVLLDLTVADNIRTFERTARVTQLPPSERAEPLRLEGRLRVKAADLSGGERRRLELLRALIGEPKVLVCDEPFAGIDPGLARQVGGLLRQYAERGVAILLSDHRVGEALEVCHSAMLLVDGRVELEGPAQGFGTQAAVARRYLQ